MQADGSLMVALVVLAGAVATSACDGDQAPGDQGPRVTITSPAALDSFDLYQDVTLSATATDPQDGTNCCAQNVRWEQFLGVLIGYGQTIVHDSFDLGGPAVRVTMTDLDGNATSILGGPTVRLFGTELAFDVNEAEIERTTGGAFSAVIAGARPAWSPDGLRIAYAAPGARSGEIWIVDANGGNPRQVTDNFVDDDAPVWSPDGTRLAYVSEAAGSRDIYTIVLSTGAITQVTPSPGVDDEPDWRGGVIVFQSDRSGNMDIWSVKDDLTEAPVQLTDDPSVDEDPHWSFGGTYVLFTSNRTGNRDVYTMNADGSGQANRTNHPASDREGVLSPDGVKIAFISDRAGGERIWFIRLDGTRPVTWTSGVGLARHPRWRP